jgi:hypothetical protein
MSQVLGSWNVFAEARLADERPLEVAGLGAGSMPQNSSRRYGKFLPQIPMRRRSLCELQRGSLP